MAGEIDLVHTSLILFEGAKTLYTVEGGILMLRG